MKPSLKLRHFLLLAAAATLPIGMAHAQTVQNIDFSNNSSGGIVLSSGENTFSFTNFNIANYLIVGGGGGGGGGLGSAGGGGGGGAGGLLEGQNLLIGGTQTIIVGAGGSGGSSGNTVGSTFAGTKGSDSSAFTLIAEGGGFGGKYDSGGGSGGSGGGAGARNSLTAGTGGTGISGQGFDGGTRTGTSTGASSGGGAGGAGLSGGSSTTGRNGGAAVTRNITGANVVYAGGGGGGGNAGGGTSETGGNGGAGSGNGSNGTVNTGGGGGGGGLTGGDGGSGGSGIVVVRYSGPQVLSGGEVSTVGGYTVHQFKTTGSSTLDLHSATIAGDISGTGNINWNKTGTLTLSGANSFNGTTTVSSGTLQVTGSGSINGSTNLTVASGATFRYNSSTDLSVGSITNNGAIEISGTGSIGVNLGLNSTSDILSPGNSPGVQDYDVSQTWSSFTYLWETNNFTGTTAGTDFDQIAITGNLDLSGGTTGSYILDLVSLTNLNADGDVPNFSEINRSWNILTATGGITGFNASYWNLETSGFTTSLSGPPEFGGAWSLAINDTAGTDSLILTYTAIPEPRAALLGGIGFLLLLRRRRR